MTTPEFEAALAAEESAQIRVELARRAYREACTAMNISERVWLREAGLADQARLACAAALLARDAERAYDRFPRECVFCGQWMRKDEHFCAKVTK